MQYCAITVEANTQQTVPAVQPMVGPAIIAGSPITSKQYADERKTYARQQPLQQQLKKEMCQQIQINQPL